MIALDIVRSVPVMEGGQFWETVRFGEIALFQNGQALGYLNGEPLTGSYHEVVDQLFEDYALMPQPTTDRSLDEAVLFVVRTSMVGTFDFFLFEPHSSEEEDPSLLNGTHRSLYDAGTEGLVEVAQVFGWNTWENVMAWVKGSYTDLPPKPFWNSRTQTWEDEMSVQGFISNPFHIEPTDDLRKEMEDAERTDSTILR